MTHFTLEKNNIEYNDVTRKWLKNSIKPGIVLDSYYYITNNRIYIVDGSKKVELNYSEKELEVAYWLVNTFGGTLYMKPRVNQPEGVKTADYFWKGEYWDLKEIKVSKSLTRAVDNTLKKQKNQAHNFILDITNCTIQIETIIFQVMKLYNYKNKDRCWIDKIIIKRNSKVIKIFMKNKKGMTPTQL